MSDAIAVAIITAVSGLGIAFIRSHGKGVKRIESALSTNNGHTIGQGVARLEGRLDEVSASIGRVEKRLSAVEAREEQNHPKTKAPKAPAPKAVPQRKPRKPKS